MLHVQSCCFAYKTYCCFDAPVAVAVVASWGPCCSKMCCKAMLRVSPPSFKPVSQQIRLLHVAQTLTSDWLKSSGSHTIHWIYVTCCKAVCLGSVKREISTYYVTKSRTSLYFPQELSQLATTWFIARQVWFVGGKTRNIAIQLVLQQCCITSCTFPLKVNSDLRPRPHLSCDNTTSTQGKCCVQRF